MSCAGSANPLVHWDGGLGFPGCREISRKAWVNFAFGIDGVPRGNWWGIAEIIPPRYGLRTLGGVLNGCRVYWG